MWRLWQGALSQSKLSARKKKQVQRMLGVHLERATSGRPQTQLKIPRITSTCKGGPLSAQPAQGPTMWAMANFTEESPDPMASRCSHPVQQVFLLIQKNNHRMRSRRVPMSDSSRSGFIEWCRTLQERNTGSKTKLWRLWPGALSQAKHLARKKKQGQRMLSGHPEKAASGRPQTQLKIPRISSTCKVGPLSAQPAQGPTMWAMANFREVSPDPEASRCSHPVQPLLLLIKKTIIGLGHAGFW